MARKLRNRALDVAIAALIAAPFLIGFYFFVSWQARSAREQLRGDCTASGFSPEQCAFLVKNL